MALTPYAALIAVHLLQPVAEPRLNVEPSCRAATSLNLADGQTLQSCMKDELEARAELAKSWTGYSGSARTRCAAEVTIGGDPSYVELLECLEMDKDASRISGSRWWSRFSRRLDAADDERVNLVAQIERAKLAEKTDRLRSALLTSISHDFKRPLAAIFGAAGTLRDLAPAFDEAAKGDVLGRIIAAACLLSPRSERRPWTARQRF
jgi:signal transduction histidine kinase